jgi:hypothetical protein
MNRTFNGYYSKVTCVPAGQQVATGLAICLKDAIGAFHHKNGVKVQRIIIYR